MLIPGEGCAHVGKAIPGRGVQRASAEAYPIEPILDENP
jgi:hypothetical protein